MSLLDEALFEVGLIRLNEERDKLRTENYLLLNATEEKDRVAQFRDQRIANQRNEICMLSEKLAAMKTWRGIVRTIGQRFGCR